MTHVTAWQHIFTSVERERSPNRRRGYQTLFYSREGLNDEDLRILESRAQYYSTPDEPIKRQFFWLADRRWVVSQVFALTERDEFGRKGRYLSHSLVFPPGSWQELGQAPFAIWAAKPFVSNLDQAFEQGSLKDGNISPRELHLDLDWQDIALNAARRWPAEALTQLARLAWQAQDLHPAGEHVGLRGSPNNVIEVLLVAFLLALPHERRFLTFDTHAVDCNWSGQEYFWAQGTPAGQEGRERFVVNADTRQVEARGLLAREPMPYTRWMERVIIPERLDHLLACQDWALALNSVIRGEAVDRQVLQSIDPPFIRDFAELNAQDVKQQIEQVIPVGLSPALIQPLLRRIGSDPYRQLRELMGGLTAEGVADMLYETFSTRSLPPTPADQKALASLAESHGGIRRMLRLWEGDAQGWRQELDLLDFSAYREAIMPLLDNRVIPSWKAISPQHIDDWFQVAITWTHSNEMVPTAQTLAECGGGQAVDLLADYVSQLEPAYQQELQAWLKKSFRRKAPRLQAALDQALGSPESTMGRLKGLLFGSGQERVDDEPPASRQREQGRGPARPEKRRGSKRK